MSNQQYEKGVTKEIDFLVDGEKLNDSLEIYLFTFLKNMNNDIGWIPYVKPNKGKVILLNKKSILFKDSVLTVDNCDFLFRTINVSDNCFINVKLSENGAYVGKFLDSFSEYKFNKKVKVVFLSDPPDFFNNN